MDIEDLKTVSQFIDEVGVLMGYAEDVLPCILEKEELRFEAMSEEERVGVEGKEVKSAIFALANAIELLECFDIWGVLDPFEAVAQRARARMFASVVGACPEIPCASEMKDVINKLSGLSDDDVPRFMNADKAMRALCGDAPRVDGFIEALRKPVSDGLDEWNRNAERLSQILKKHIRFN